MNPVMVMPVFLFLSIGSISLFSFIAVATWVDSRGREREAYYKSETLKKIAESEGPTAKSALEFLYEQERLRTRRKREGIKLGGLVTVAVGLGLFPLLRAVVPNEPDYLASLIPLFIGFALLIYGYVLAPKE